ncbi:MAG TPA: hypothetical protein DEB24_07695, partial [Coriobacteriia bacterium]|nr:hypothetical protein [Coriobacteriia bacterium]
MPILGAFAVPHPPIIVPGVGKGEELEARATIDAFHEVGRRIAALEPELLVIVTPHGELFRDAFHVTVGSETADEQAVDGRVWGDFAEFRDPKNRLDCVLDGEFVEALIAVLDGEGGSPGAAVSDGGDAVDPADVLLPYVASPMPGNKLDHGCMVPLHFISQYVSLDLGLNPDSDAQEPPCKIARVAVSLMGPESHLRLGRAIARAVEVLDRRTVFIASGDLSHKLEGSHYGFNPAGPVFDRKIVDIFTSGNLRKLLDFDEALREDAAECGLNSFIVMAGALEDLEIESELLSYEGPWGIGYGLAAIMTQPRSDAEADGVSHHSHTSDHAEATVAGRAQDTNDEHPSADGNVSTQPSLPVRLAFAVLDDLLDGTQRPDAHSPMVAKLLASLNASDQAFVDKLRSRQAGCFVSLHKGPDLRGCIGTIAATCDNLFEEICQNAVSTVSRDPRFPAVRREELPQLSCSVDVLGPAEPVTDRSTLDAERFGVIVTSGYRRGVLLPDLEGVDTPEEQVAIALQKAGIAPDQPYELERFEVI